MRFLQQFRRGASLPRPPPESKRTVRLF